MPSSSVLWANKKRTHRRNASKSTLNPPDTHQPTDDSLCERCQTIKVAKSLTNKPDSSNSKRTGTSSEGTIIAHLGHYDNFDRASPNFVPTNCPLCTMVSDIIPERPRVQHKRVLEGPSLFPISAISDMRHGIEPDQVYLAVASALSRFEPKIQVERLNLYSNFLYVGVGRPVFRIDNISEVLEATGNLYDEKPLGVRLVDPSSVNLKAVRGWIQRCEQRHSGTCRSTWDSELRGIRLIDTETRKIVPYPESPVRYLCLSYVWGEYQPSDTRIRQGVLENAPLTIEDAITFTKKLGEKYLWVDTVCINQDNQAQKQAHMDMMDKIYGGAWATIVALDGKSAASGLPRVNPARLPRRQHKYNIDNITLSTTFPTLRQQVENSTWASRAWTLQEAILSPRNIFFTKDQVYFSCNTAECCESTHDATSPFHNQLIDKSLRYQPTLYNKIASNIPPNFESGIFRNPEADLPDGARDLEMDPDFQLNRLHKYGELVQKYSFRNLTHQTDALAAFQGILNQLELTWFQRRSVNSGTDTVPGTLTPAFIWGLPISVLPEALLFSHGKIMERRAEFPSWSWLGWKGALVLAAAKAKQNRAPVAAWHWSADGLSMIYPATLPEIVPSPHLVIHNHLSGMDESEAKRRLVVEACVFDLHFIVSSVVSASDNFYFELFGTIEDVQGNGSIICTNQKTVDLVVQRDGHLTVLLLGVFSPRPLEASMCEFLLLDVERKTSVNQPSLETPIILARRLGTLKIGSIELPWQEMKANGLSTQVVLE